MCNLWSGIARGTYIKFPSVKIFTQQWTHDQTISEALDLRHAEFDECESV